MWVDEVRRVLQREKRGMHAEEILEFISEEGGFVSKSTNPIKQLRRAIQRYMARGNRDLCIRDGLYVFDPSGFVEQRSISSEDLDALEDPGETGNSMGEYVERCSTLSRSLRGASSVESLGLRDSLSSSSPNPLRYRSSPAAKPRTLLHSEPQKVEKHDGSNAIYRTTRYRNSCFRPENMSDELFEFSLRMRKQIENMSSRASDSSDPAAILSSVKEVISSREDTASVAECAAKDIVDAMQNVESVMNGFSSLEGGHALLLYEDLLREMDSRFDSVRSILHQMDATVEESDGLLLFQLPYSKESSIIAATSSSIDRSSPSDFGPSNSDSNM